MDGERIDPTQAQRDVTAGNALLVCAYDSQEKCRNNQLAGAMNMQELQALEDKLPPDREIIFYCA